MNDQQFQGLTLVDGPHAAAVAEALAVERQRVIRAAAAAASYQDYAVYRTILRAYPTCGVTARAWRAMSTRVEYSEVGMEQQLRREPDGAQLLAAANGGQEATVPVILVGDPDRIPGVVIDVKPEADDDQEEGAGCECDQCDNPRCDGQCAECSDHGCQQCWGSPDAADECDDHECQHHYPDGCLSTSDCCGWCEECDRHTGDSRENVCDMGVCHECEHTCEDTNRRRWR
jgi:hypothetical protein